VEIVHCVDSFEKVIEFSGKDVSLVAEIIQFVPRRFQIVQIDSIQMSVELEHHFIDCVQQCLSAVVAY
jgi:hypothetical protein